MGRSYWFECAKCGYRAKVSGRADRGLHLFVQTIVCEDCKELYDAVTRLRVPTEPRSPLLGRSLLRRPGQINHHRIPRTPPPFQLVFNRLFSTGVRWSRWAQFKPQCPVSAIHRVRSWNEPDKCPRCGIYLERSALPYRIWE